METGARRPVNDAHQMHPNAPQCAANKIALSTPLAAENLEKESIYPRCEGREGVCAMLGLDSLFMFRPFARLILRQAQDEEIFCTLMVSLSNHRQAQGQDEKYF
jgi:hypothetical protein